MLITKLTVKSDFMEIPSEIPESENCPKCAFMINGHCAKVIDLCGFGRKGYYAIAGRIMEEAIEK